MSFWRKTNLPHGAIADTASANVDTASANVTALISSVARKILFGIGI
jgi:hypothetical protein